MQDISAIDKNFAIPTSLDISDILFRDVREVPFQICGVFYENGKYRRLPEAVVSTLAVVA